MTCGNGLVLYELGNGFGEIKKTKRICNGGAALSHLLCDLLLGEIESLDKRVVCHCFFDRVEIFTLKVLDECHLRGLEIVAVEYDGGNFVKSAKL